MGLIEQLESDIAKAMRERDQVRLSVLRLLKNALKNQQIEVGHELDAREMLAVLQKEAKKRRDSIEAYGKAGRDDLVQEESGELTEIESYLPKQMDEDEVRSVVIQVISGKTVDMAQMGQIIGQVISKCDGRADGTIVSRVVREEITKQS